MVAFEEDSKQSIFLLGDLVLQNPKETGAIFGIVVILSILLENIFAFFRRNKSKYVRLLFSQVSEEVMIVGTIGLLFVFIVQSFDNLPSRWVLLFTWTQTVIFFMMFFFLIGIVITAFLISRVLQRFKHFEENLSKQHLGNNARELDLSKLDRAFAVCRSTYMHQLRSPTTTSDLGRFTEEAQKLPFSKYLEPKLRATMIKVTDITWQCWLSLIFAAGANSIRLFLLPGDLQDKDPSDFTTQNRIANYVSFIIIVGYIPLAIFCVAFTLLLRNFFGYQASVEAMQPVNLYMEQQNECADDISAGCDDPLELGERPTSATAAAMHTNFSPLTPRGDGARRGRQITKLRTASGAAWLPPKQLTAQLLGEMCEDPSRYLLRSNRSFTLHMFKVPCVLMEFYFSIFVVGMWGEMSSTIGTAQIGLIPFALLPMAVIFGLLPVAVVIITALTSLGTRLDTDELIKIIHRRRRPVRRHRKEEAEDSASDNDVEASRSILRIPENTAKEHPHCGDKNITSSLDFPASEGANTEDVGRDQGGRHGSEEDARQSAALQSEVAALKARVCFLEELCVSFGVPISGRAVDDAGEFTAQSSLAVVLASVSKVAEQNRQILEQQQQQLAAVSKYQRPTPDMSGISSMATDCERDRVRQPEAASLDALSAARKLQVANVGGTFSVTPQARPASTAASLAPIHAAAAAAFKRGASVESRRDAGEPEAGPLGQRLPASGIIL